MKIGCTATVDCVPNKIRKKAKSFLLNQSKYLFVIFDFDVIHRAGQRCFCLLGVISDSIISCYL